MLPKLNNPGRLWYVRHRKPAGGCKRAVQGRLIDNIRPDVGGTGNHFEHIGHVAYKRICEPLHQRGSQEPGSSRGSEYRQAWLEAR